MSRRGVVVNRTLKFQPWSAGKHCKDRQRGPVPEVESETRVRSRSRIWRRLTVGMSGLALTAGVVAVVAPAASAAAYPIGVYAPSKISTTQARGWANLSLDCTGTYGCYNYIQIQVLRWYGPSIVKGWWANNNGWNNITATLLPGCYDYRTRTDSYNYSVGDVGGGVNVGVYGISASGQKIYEWHREWNSGWSRICR